MAEEKTQKETLDEYFQRCHYDKGKCEYCGANVIWRYNYEFGGDDAYPVKAEPMKEPRLHDCKPHLKAEIEQLKAEVRLWKDLHANVTAQLFDLRDK